MRSKEHELSKWWACSEAGNQVVNRFVESVKRKKPQFSLRLKSQVFENTDKNGGPAQI